jgi:hypothetical protein
MVVFANGASVEFSRVSAAEFAALCRSLGSPVRVVARGRVRRAVLAAVAEALL